MPGPLGWRMGHQAVHPVPDDVVGAAASEPGSDRGCTGQRVLEPVQLALGPVEALIKERRKADVRAGSHEGSGEFPSTVHPRPDLIQGGSYAWLIGGPEPDSPQAGDLTRDRVDRRPSHLVVAQPDRDAVVDDPRLSWGIAGAIRLRVRIPGRLERVADDPHRCPGNTGQTSGQHGRRGYDQVGHAEEFLDQVALPPSSRPETGPVRIGQRVVVRLVHDRSPTQHARVGRKQPDDGTDQWIDGQTVVARISQMASMPVRAGEVVLTLRADVVGRVEPPEQDDVGPGDGRHADLAKSVRACTFSCSHCGIGARCRATAQHVVGEARPAANLDAQRGEGLAELPDAQKCADARIELAIYEQMKSTRHRRITVHAPPPSGDVGVVVLGAIGGGLGQTRDRQTARSLRPMRRQHHPQPGPGI